MVTAFNMQNIKLITTIFKRRILISWWRLSTHKISNYDGSPCKNPIYDSGLCKQISWWRPLLHKPTLMTVVFISQIKVIKVSIFQHVKPNLWQWPSTRNAHRWLFSSKCIDANQKYQFHSGDLQNAVKIMTVVFNSQK